MKKSKLAKVLAPNLEEYTSLELAYLLQELLKEIQRRQQKAPKAIDLFNQKTFEYTHEIELGTKRSRKEKADFYEEMEKHFEDRRLAKNESIIVEDIFNNMSLPIPQVLNRLANGIRDKNAYYQIHERKRLVKPSIWNDFYDKYL